MDPKAVLFDLDLTLVNSSSLTELRKRRDWDQIYQRLGEIRPYMPKEGPAPHQIPALLKANGKRVAIVTSSPASYARAILTQFRIPFDVLVAYFDTVAHKPDPEPVNLALDRLGLEPDDCLYVGDDPIDARAAFHAKLKSVGALWRYASQADPDLKEFWRSSPDIALLQPGTLLLPDQLGDCRYIGEAIVGGHAFYRHEGYRMFWREPGGVRVECLGRYYVAGDERSGQAWTRRVLDLKDDPAVGVDFVPVIAEFLNRYPWKPDTVVPVPPKPGKESRFTGILDALPGLLTTECSPVVEGLTCERAVEGYKDLQHAARDTSIRGTVRTGFNWTGRRVLLLDDVVTSGSTTRECARILRQAGAADVILLALALSQESFTFMRCPACGRTMRRRERKRDKAPFWGCSGYRSGVCKHIVPIEP